MSLSDVLYDAFARTSRLEECLSLQHSTSTKSDVQLDALSSFVTSVMNDFSCENMSWTVGITDIKD